MGLLIRLIICVGLLYWTFGPVHQVDPRLEDTVNEVERILKAACSPHKIYYPNRTYIVIGKIKKDIIGMCSTDHNGDFKITIDEDFYNTSNPTTLFSVVAHELTHCELHIDHSSIPYNYMGPALDPSLPKPLIIIELTTNALFACEKSDVK